MQAISILVYSNAGQDILQSLLYPGLIEELVDVLGVSDSRLTVSTERLLGAGFRIEFLK